MELVNCIILYQKNKNKLQNTNLTYNIIILNYN